MNHHEMDSLDTISPSGADLSAAGSGLAAQGNIEAILGSIAAIAVVVDANHQRLLFANEEASQFFGAEIESTVLDLVRQRIAGTSSTTISTVRGRCVRIRLAMVTNGSSCVRSIVMSFAKSGPRAMSWLLV